MTPVDRILATDTKIGHGFGGFVTALLIFSFICWMEVFAAQTVLQQGIALLAWIGLCVFWGTFIVVAAIRSRL